MEGVNADNLTKFVYAEKHIIKFVLKSAKKKKKNYLNSL